MSVKRVDNSPADQALKRAAAQLVHIVGGMEKAEGFCRSNYRRLSEYGRPDTDCFMPVDVVRDLEEVSHGLAGHPIVTRHLAARAGYALVRLPSAEPIGTAELHAACAGHAKEHGEATARVIGLLVGHTREGVEDAIREVEEGIEKSVQLHALLLALREQA